MPPSLGVSANVELRTVRNRELELKRLTGEISCAECRRLKLKCDKEVPCSSCVRRGCMKICPLGTITGNIGRHITTSSAANKDGVARKLIARIAALEDALHLQSGDSTHPLLSPELLAIKEGSNASSHYAEENEDAEPHTGLVSAFGTLSVSDGKAMRFLGASAADSVLLMEVFDPSTVPDIMNSDSLPKEMIQASGMWPFVPAYLSQSEHITQLVSHLPSYERATSLMETYFANLVWLIAPIERSQATDEIIPFFYPEKRPVLPELVEAEKLHELALLFSLLACGGVADFTQPAVNPEAERFSRLARAALGIRSILDFSSFEACQTLWLMAAYENYSGRKTSQESSDKLMSIGLTMATTIGLHLDPSRWNLGTKLANWRRRAFWEINSLDKWRSLGSGRPWVFPRNAVDCEFPLDSGATIDEDGTVVESVWQWRYRFARDVVSVLVEKICVPRPLRYSEVMEMDRLVREFKLHAFVYNIPKRTSFATDGEYGSLPPHMTLWLKETALLYVHRNYFARSMLEYPGDPMRSPLAPSFLSAYRSSVTLLDLLNKASDRVPIVMQRLFGVWASLLNCAVIIGCAASRVTTVQFAESAFRELDKAISLFESVDNHPIARNGLKLLCRLRTKARAAYHARVSPSPPLCNTDLESRGSSQLFASQSPLTSDGLEGNNEELNILLGTTRYVDRQTKTSSPPLERSHARTHLTCDGRPLSSTSASSSPYVEYTGSASTSSSPYESVPTPPSDALEGFLPDTSGAASANEQYSPSSFATSPEHFTTRKRPRRVDSDDVMQDHSSKYDEHFESFAAESLFQESSRGSLQFNGALPQTVADRSVYEGNQQQHPGYSVQSYPAASSIHQANMGPPSYTSQDASISSIPSYENQYAGVNGAGSSGTVFPSASDPFAGFDFTLDSTRSTDSFFPESSPDAHMMANLDAAYQKGDSNTSQAWYAFMQHFNVASSEDMVDGDWETLLVSR